MQRFLKLVDKAFTPKFLGGVSFGTTKYRTQPLEEALHDSFKDEAMFGGRRETMPVANRRVAVTSAKDTAEKAVIFTNYNRPQDETRTLYLMICLHDTDIPEVDYELLRPDNPAHDVKVWEA